MQYATYLCTRRIISIVLLKMTSQYVSVLAVLIWSSSPPITLQDCIGPPTIDNPYGVIIDPVQDIYTDWSRVDLRCEDGTMPYGPEYSYCDPTPGDWDPDVSSFVCYATCDANDFDSDIMITPSANERKVFDHGTTVTVSCAVPGVRIGPDSGTCKNGTWDFATFPSCAAYCLEPVGRYGLLYAPDPPINDTGLYYYDDDQITYTCDEMYQPLNCAEFNCTTTCNDGIWQPATLPICQEIRTSTSPQPTTTSYTTTPSPPGSDDGPVSSACMHCIWSVVANCRVPNPTCQVNADSVLVCGPYHISEKYWEAARIDGDNLGKDWVACASTFECSERAVQGFMTLFANECRLEHEPSCEDFAKMHYGGPVEYDSAEAAEFWAQVEICLNPFGPEK